MQHEKRRHNRLPVLHEMDEPIQIALGGKAVPGILVDLSAGGMALLTFTSIPVGSDVTLSIDVPGLKTQPLSGKVAWLLSKGDMWRIGIVFSQIDPIDFRHINRLAFDCADCDTKLGLGVTDIVILCESDLNERPVALKNERLRTPRGTPRARFSSPRLAS
jgi:hypothetical protein